jgi:ABC-2 type transport system ATP-binding protein
VADQAAEVKKIINLSPQETAVAPNLTVKENLELMGGLYGLSGEGLLSKNVEWAIREFHLEEVLHDKAKNLSGGWQRRLSIAMALVSRPEVLFLDEPTLGLDVLARSELWDMIRSLKGQVTIVLTTHYMEEAEALSDRVAILKNGGLLVFDTPAKIKEIAGADRFEDAFIRFVKEEK